MMYGQLVPMKDGEPIDLEKERVQVGRHKMCDVVLNYGNVSEHHCLMQVIEGYWFVRDLNSTNGVRVNGKRIQKGMNKRVDPDSNIAFAKHEFILKYDPSELGAYGTPPSDQSLGA